MFYSRFLINRLIDTTSKLKCNFFKVTSFHRIGLHSSSINKSGKSLVKQIRPGLLSNNRELITSSNSYQSGSNRDRNGTPLFAASFISGLLSFLGWDDLLSKEDPFILTIKRGILCMQREEFDKAEIILHAALTNAVETGNEKAIVYIYSLLGNTAFLKGDYEKSEKIYLDLIKRLLKQGIDETHEAMIEISVKLATIYSKLGKFNKADVGFSHCIDIQKNRTSKIGLDNSTQNKLSDEEINSLALYGMVLDFYGKHLLRKQEFEGALKYTLDALAVCEKVNGVNAHQTMILLNDAGTLLNLSNHFDEADEYFQRAIKIGTIIESDHLKTLYYNIGMNNVMRKNWSLAQHNCNASYKYAQQEDDTLCMSMAEECLKKAKSQKVG